MDKQADEVLRELASLFKGFGQLAPGSMGRRALDPTGLRLALAKLDPKRFAAGRAAAGPTSSNPPCRGYKMAQMILGVTSPLALSTKAQCLQTVATALQQLSLAGHRWPCGSRQEFRI